MGFRFRRSFRLFPGLRLNLSRSGMSASVGRRGAWLTLGPRGARATVGIPGTGLSYSEQSPWARPKPHIAQSPGIEVAELQPLDKITVTPVLPPRATGAAPAHDETRGGATAAEVENADDDEQQSERRLVLIALAIVAIVAVAALGWALLV